MKKRALPVFILLVILVAALSWVIFSPNKVLTSYHIDSQLQQLQRSQVDKVVQPYLGQSFWKLDLDKLHAQIVRLDWVYHATVSRHWPSQLEIVIEEQKPVVRWGQDGLLNKNGDIFYPNNISAYQNLVELKGEDAQSKTLLEHLVVFQKIFSKLGWTISKLVISPDSIWKIEFLKHPEVVLDHKDWQHKLDRFVRAYPQIKTSLRKNARLYDLRYSNGFAIKQNTTDSAAES